MNQKNKYSDLDKKIEDNNLNVLVSETTDWDFDFSSLPRWDNRKKSILIYDKFYYVEQSDTLFCIYSIVEVRMGDYRGFLAILKNKKHPELILNISDKINFYDNFSVNKNGNIVFLKSPIYNEKTEKVFNFIFIIDIEKRKFSYFKNDNYSSCYKVVELNDFVFEIEDNNFQLKNNKWLNYLSKPKIDLRKIKWFDFSEIKNLNEKTM